MITFDKGVEYHHTMKHFIEVNKNTRAGRNGKEIICPLCKASITVHHFAWSALICDSCDAAVQKSDWLINIGE
jgi:uncharacterized CHY-type Zn-finger protein